LLHKKQRDAKGGMKSFKEGSKYFGCLKPQKLRELNLHYLGRVLLKYKKI